MHLQVNSILFTLDGRSIGNAIIKDIYFCDQLKSNVYVIKTDYGNEATLSKDEIYHWFHEKTEIADNGHKHYTEEPK